MQTSKRSYDLDIEITHGDHCGDHANIKKKKKKKIQCIEYKYHLITPPPDSATQVKGNTCTPARSSRKAS